LTQDAERNPSHREIVFLDMGTLSANLIRYPAGHGMKPHTDGCRRLSVVVFGDLAEGDRRTVEAGAVGSVGLKAPDFVHETRFGPAGACIVSAILPDPLVRRIGSSPESLAAWRWVHDGAASLAGLRLASALWRRDGDVAEAALTTLLAGFLDDRRSEVPPSVPLARVRERLHDVGEPPNVKRLARQVGMHPGALNRAFRRAFGCSLTRYRQRVRVNGVARALIRSDEELAQVALRFGFADLSHMTRVFGRELSVSPGAFRAAMRDVRGFESFKTEWAVPA
jgi:AraC-like DNA-binding protein